MKIRGRPSRASIQPRPEPSEVSYVSESENDTFLTAKSAQQTFMSAEATFSADATVQNNDDKTVLESDAVTPLVNVASAMNGRELRSAAKRRRQSRSVMNLNKTPRDALQSTSRFKRNARRRRSAPGLVCKEEGHKRKMSESIDDGMKMLESTPTDHAAAKRKFSGSEPARKQMLLNLSPIEIMPSQTLTKTKSDPPMSNAKRAAKDAEVPTSGSTNDTICLSSKPTETKSAKKEVKPPTKISSSSQPAVSGSHGNIATSVAAFRGRAQASPRLVARKLASPRAAVQKPVRIEQNRKLTIPTSPKFATRSRVNNKHIDYEPLEVREKKVAEEMKKYRFKAQPAPKNVFKSATAVSLPVIPKASKMLPPKAKSDVAPTSKVQASSSKAALLKKQEISKPKIVEKKKVFGLTAGGGVSKKRSTEARTPTFKLSDRIRQKNDMKKLTEAANRARVAAKAEEEKAKREKFMKAALKGIPPKSNSSTASSGPVEKLTKPAPFSFHESDQQRKVNKERKIQDVYDEEKRKREFRAQPLPNLHVVSGLPVKEVKPATRPEPFNLATEDRNAAAHTTWSTTVDSEILETEEQFVFKARPMPDLSIPFIPEKSNREPTEPLPIVLHTAVRAEDRKPFDEYVKAREEELEEVKRQREIEREEEEHREALKLRKSMVHQAQPIRHYKPTIIEHNRIPPTVPESPAFATRTRAQVHAARAALAAALEEQDERDSNDTYVVNY